MKRLFLAMIVVGFLFNGCESDNSSVTAPDTGNQLASDMNEPNWIKLPAPETQKLQKVISVTELVRADRATAIHLSEKYEGGPYGEVEIKAMLKFNPGTVDTDTEVTMSIDGENGVITFGPSVVFNQPAILDVEIEGIDLQGADENNIEFVYLRLDGTYEPVDYQKLKIGIEDGELGLVRGKIPHFSRFGFVR